MQQFFCYKANQWTVLVLSKVCKFLWYVHKYSITDAGISVCWCQSGQSHCSLFWRKTYLWFPKTTLNYNFRSHDSLISCSGCCMFFVIVFLPTHDANLLLVSRSSLIFVFDSLIISFFTQHSTLSETGLRRICYMYDFKRDTILFSFYLTLNQNKLFLFYIT